MSQEFGVNAFSRRRSTKAATSVKTGKNAGMLIALIVTLVLSLMYLSNARFFKVLEEKTYHF